MPFYIDEIQAAMKDPNMGNSSEQVSTVPEPSGLLLMVITLAGSALARPSRRRSR